MVCLSADALATGNRANRPKRIKEANGCGFSGRVERPDPAGPLALKTVRAATPNGSLPKTYAVLRSVPNRDGPSTAHWENSRRSIFPAPTRRNGILVRPRSEEPTAHHEH